MKPYLRILLFIFFVFMLLHCSKDEVIKIGFSSTLTGKLSEEGIESRNAIILAVEEINAKGGINGKNLQLLIRDDQNNAEIAKNIDLDLIKEQVVAIIGHTYSNMTQAVYQMMQEKKMLIISPTNVSDLFSGKDDYFIRLHPSNKLVVQMFAEYIFKEKKISKIFAVYEGSNKEYSVKWLETFKEKFISLGGKVFSPISYDINDHKTFRKAMQELKRLKPENLLIISTPLEAALISKEVKTKFPYVNLFISGWGMTDNYIKSGGKLVEGAVFSYNSIHNGTNLKYSHFKLKYKERFGSSPNYYARNSYESLYVLAEALKRVNNPTPDNIKKAILEQKTFSGLKEDIIIDSFGDRLPFPTLYTVKNGQFIRIR